MATILLVDDEAEILELLEIYLQNNRHTVLKYTDPLQLEKQDLSGVELAVLDVMMPGIDGFTLCRQWRSQGLTFPVIMLTARDAAGDKINGLSLGADDYVTKPFDPLELLARINAQLRRAQMLSSDSGEKEMFDVNGLVLRPQAHSCTLYGREIALTPIEFSILLLLCRNRGRVIGSEQIFEEVWGEKYLDSNNTVMVHVQKLRKKLGDTGKQKKFIQTVWGVGYKIES